MRGKEAGMKLENKKEMAGPALFIAVAVATFVFFWWFITKH